MVRALRRLGISQALQRSLEMHSKGEGRDVSRRGEGVVRRVLGVCIVWSVSIVGDLAS
jgi:hypothetical protein